MGFLVPLYLLGALAVAVPIYLHLRRKPPKDSVEFGSLMFLEATEYPPVKRSRRLENLPLLLLRCLALLLLAGFFARPFLGGGEEEVGEGQTRTVLLIDTSASMQREGVWEEAKAEALELLSEHDAQSPFAILTVDTVPRTVVGFDDWQEASAAQRKDLAKGAIEAIEATWMGTDLGSGLLAATDLLADATADGESRMNGRVVLVSDLQSGAELDAVAGASWPDGLEVELKPLEVGDPTNASVALAAGSDPEHPLVRVSNDENSERERFLLTAGETEIPTVVPPGESRVFELPPGTGEVLLSGDAHEFDNRVFLAPREPVAVSFAFLGDADPGDADGLEYYFRRAFGPSEFLAPRFVEELGEKPEVVVVARSLETSEGDEVRELLEDGARVLVVLASTAMDETLGSLVGEELELSEATGRYALLEDIDFDHPVLSGFHDPRWRDFTEVHFWHHRKLAAMPDAKVIARFDDGAPAWLEVSVGKGSLVVMTSGWQPKDSQLALSSKFVPLLYSIFAEQGLRVGESRRFHVGERLPLEAGDRQVIAPDGERREVSAESDFRALEPGVYQVEGELRSRRLAVNSRPSESVLRPLGSSSMLALGVPLADSVKEEVVVDAAGKRRLRNREAEERQDWWRWAALVLLFLLLVESALASRGSNPSMEGVAS